MAFYNPYQQYNPYGYAPVSQQNVAGSVLPQQSQIIRVNGKNGAEAFRMAPNSSILLMDENDPIVWLKTSDGAGYCTVTPYTIAPYQSAPPVDVNSLENRVKRVEDMRNAKSDDGDAKPKRKTE